MLNLHLQPTHTFSLVYIWFELKAPSYIFCPVSAPNIHNLLLVPIVPLSRLNPFKVLRETKSWVRLFVLMVIALHFTWVQTGEPGGRWWADTAGRVGVPANESVMNTCDMCRVLMNLQLNFGLLKENHRCSGIWTINAVWLLKNRPPLSDFMLFQRRWFRCIAIFFDFPRVEVVMCSCVIVSSTSAVTRLSHYTEPQHNKLNS